MAAAAAAALQPSLFQDGWGFEAAANEVVEEAGEDVGEEARGQAVEHEGLRGQSPGGEGKDGEGARREGQHGEGHHRRAGIIASCRT